MRSMIAASVDDFPEPVGPVTSTMPFFSSAIAPSDRRKAQILELGIPGAMTRMMTAWVFRWRKTFTRKRARSGKE